MKIPTFLREPKNLIIGFLLLFLIISLSLPRQKNVTVNSDLINYVDAEKKQLKRTIDSLSSVNKILDAKIKALDVEKEMIDGEIRKQDKKIVNFKNKKDAETYRINVLSDSQFVSEFTSVLLSKD